MSSYSIPGDLVALSDRPVDGVPGVRNVNVYADPILASLVAEVVAATAPNAKA